MPSDSSFNRALLALIEHIASSDKPVIIDYEIALKWNIGAIDAFMKLGLIGTASMAQSTECKGCENHCFMDVLTQKYGLKTRAFIVCEDTDMQSQMGRMEIPIEHLKQWQSSPKHIANVISNLLNLDRCTQKNANNKIRLGMMKSPKGRRWVALQFEPLGLEINQYHIPIKELLYYEGEQLLIDRFRIDDLLERSPKTNNKKYTPSTDRREARKLITRAMYQDWNDEYMRLKKHKPNMGDVWYSNQIAKMEIAQGKTAGTIIKKMKN